MTQPLPCPIAAAYLDWCERERVPANTVRRRRSVLRNVGNPGTATREEMEAWWDTRHHLADSSRANELAVLRAFYRWCQIWEHRDDNPVVRLAPPQIPNSLPRPASAADLQRVLTTIGDNPVLRRAIYLGAYAGCRVSEAAALHWAQINVETRRATILGKGRKRRVVALGQFLVDELGPSHPGYVVTGTTDTITADALRQRVNRAFAKAGVPITYHQLRHRFGTVAYQASKDLVAVRDLMGHSSIATTSGYAAAADDTATMIAEAVR